MVNTTPVTGRSRPPFSGEFLRDAVVVSLAVVSLHL
jgi:hypothetical protein